MTTSSISKPAQIALTTARAATTVTQVASGVSTLGLLVVSILMLTNVVPGGLPVALTTGAVGVIFISGRGLAMIFGGKKNKKTGLRPFLNTIPARVAMLAVGVLFGGTLITLGGLHAANILGVHQLAAGILGAWGASIVLGIGVAIPLRIRHFLSPEQKSLRARVQAAKLQARGIQPTAAPYNASDHLAGATLRDLSAAQF